MSLAEHFSRTETGIMTGDSQINGGNVRDAKNELGCWWLYPSVYLWLRSVAVDFLLLFSGDWLIIQLPTNHLLHTMPIVSMVRVGGVEERELRVLTLVLADFVLELWRIGRPGNEGCCPIYDSYTCTSVPYVRGQVSTRFSTHI